MEPARRAQANRQNGIQANHMTTMTQQHVQGVADAHLAGAGVRVRVGEGPALQPVGDGGGDLGVAQRDVGHGAGGEPAQDGHVPGGDLVGGRVLLHQALHGPRVHVALLG